MIPPSRKKTLRQGFRCKWCAWWEGDTERKEESPVKDVPVTSDHRDDDMGGRVMAPKDARLLIHRT